MFLNRISRERLECKMTPKITDEVPNIETFRPQVCFSDHWLGWADIVVVIVGPRTWSHSPGKSFEHLMSKREASTEGSWAVWRPASRTSNGLSSCANCDNNSYCIGMHLFYDHTASPTDEAFGLGGKLFALLGPSLFLASQAADEAGRRLHLVSAALGVLQQSLVGQRKDK